MTTSWTAESIVALAPDASAAKAGQGLAAPRKWVSLSTNDVAAWGECQGSGATPYRTQIDLSGPAFRCTCPSRKLPCKHSLGLFLLLAETPGSFKQEAPPDWVSEWLAGRERRAGAEPKKKAAKSDSPAAAERELRVAAGLSDLDTWLQDGVRNGLAGLQNKPLSFWENTAARLVDAQAPGAGRLVRNMAGTPASGDGWEGRLLEQMGSLYLLISAYGRIYTLAPDTQAEVRSILGWNTTREELLERASERKRRLVIAQKLEQQEKLRAQRTWLLDEETGSAALILDYAAPREQFDTVLAPGTSIDAELVYYPGVYPQRALLKERYGAPERFGKPGGSDIATALARYGAALAQSPWLERIGVALDGVLLQVEDNGWSVRDANNNSLPIFRAFEAGWKLLALSGGKPLLIFGEWDGRFFTPLSAWSDHFTQF